MPKIEMEIILAFNRKEDIDLYNLYSAIGLLLGSVNSSQIRDISEFEKTMDEGKKYKLTIEEI